MLLYSVHILSSYKVEACNMPVDTDQESKIFGDVDELLAIRKQEVQRYLILLESRQEQA
jgi:hypothetical protein